VDNSRVLIGNATHFDRIHLNIEFDKEADRIAGFFEYASRISEWGCSSGELGLALKRKGVGWYGFEEREPLRKLSVEKHGADTVGRSLCDAGAGSITHLVSWFAPFARVSPEDLNGTAMTLSDALSVGGCALVEDWYRPDEARAGWALMDTYDGEDFKLSRCAVTKIEGIRATFPFFWLAAKMGEEPEGFQEEAVLWLHSEKSLTDAFDQACLRHQSVSIDGLRCWKLTKV